LKLTANRFKTYSKQVWNLQQTGLKLTTNRFETYSKQV
jgi:hypothetical protein